MMLAPDINLEIPLRIVIAGGQDTIRSAIRSAAERAGFAIAGVCGDGASATATVVRERAHLCLIAAGLPRADEAVVAIASLPLAPKVVVLGSAKDGEVFFDALALGAAGCLLDDMEPARLADELRTVAEGGMALAPAVAGRLIDDLRSRRHSTPPGALTDREWDALELVARGLTTTEIAVRLRVSPTAVRRHVSSAVRQVVSARPRDTSVANPGWPCSPGRARPGSGKRGRV